MSCYSLDLRERVISFLKDNKSITKTSKLFNISRPTIYDWKRRDKIDQLKPQNNFRNL
ncbi:IS630 transposase-related protein [Pseudomonadota bacterium]